MSDVEVSPPRAEPQYPWRLDTNDRYRETVTTAMSLSTAALLLPVFLAREFLGIKSDVALKNVFTCAVYWSWGGFIDYAPSDMAERHDHYLYGRPRA